MAPTSTSAHPSAPARSGRRPPGRLLVLAVAVLALVGLMATPALAGPPIDEDATRTVTLGQAMEGEVDGLDVKVVDSDEWYSSAIAVEVIADNSTNAPILLEIEPGTLLEPEDESAQTLTVPGGNQTGSELAAGDVSAITLPTGGSTHELTAYCAQETDFGVAGPYTYGGVAAEPLPTVLENIAAQDPDAYTAQEAVWWVTDRPEVPVAADVAPLLAGVDTAAFAASPEQVVPDEGYTPYWDGGPAGNASYDVGLDTVGLTGGDPSRGIGAWLLLAFLVAGAGAFVLGVTRAGRKDRPTPAPVTVNPTARAAGWYPDPWRIATYRWWDGQSWSSQTQ